MVLNFKIKLPLISLNLKFKFKITIIVFESGLFLTDYTWIVGVINKLQLLFGQDQ